MRARALIRRSSFGPETIKLMCQALDLAWADVANIFDKPLAREAARLVMANAILDIARTRKTLDLAELRLAAHLAVSVRYPWLFEAPTRSVVKPSA